MKLMDQFHINTPKFAVASTPKEAEEAACDFLADEENRRHQEDSLSSSSVSGGGGAGAGGGLIGEPIDFVVKAQVLAGGRGLGYFKENGYQGGVQVCESPREVGIVAGKMLGKTLVTKQTGKEGKKCHQVLITERFFIRKEKYVAILMDRGAGCPVLIGRQVNRGAAFPRRTHVSPEKKKKKEGS